VGSWGGRLTGSSTKKKNKTRWTQNKKKDGSARGTGRKSRAPSILMIPGGGKKKGAKGKTRHQEKAGRTEKGRKNKRHQDLQKRYPIVSLYMKA